MKNKDWLAKQYLKFINTKVLKESPINREIVPFECLKKYVTHAWMPT